MTVGYSGICLVRNDGKADVRKTTTSVHNSKTTATSPKLFAGMTSTSWKSLTGGFTANHTTSNWKNVGNSVTLAIIFYLVCCMYLYIVFICVLNSPLFNEPRISFSKINLAVVCKHCKLQPRRRHTVELGGRNFQTCDGNFDFDFDFFFFWCACSAYAANMLCAPERPSVVFHLSAVVYYLFCCLLLLLSTGLMPWNLKFVVPLHY